MPHCVTLRALTTHLRIVSVPPMSDALTVTLPDSTRPAAPTAGRGRLRVDRTALATLAMLALCMTAGAVLLRDRAPASDDGAGSVPVIALIGIAVAVTRWHPRSGEVPVRGIAPSVALAIGGAAGLLLAGLVVSGGHGGGAGLAVGMSITLGLAGGYLLAWGYRSIALLRTVVLLSLLTWPPIGDLTRPRRGRLRIGVHTQGIGRGANPEVTELTLKTAALLEELGHQVDEVAAPVGESFPDDFLLYWSSLAFFLLRQGRRLHGRSWAPDQLDHITHGLAGHARRRLHRLPGAIGRLRRSRLASEEFFRHHDVLLAPVIQPWYLLWALAPAAATDRPRLQALLGWGCVVLATLMPPTGGDFLHRGYELINAIAAAALLLLAWAGIDRFRQLRAAGAPTAARERIADRRR